MDWKAEIARQAVENKWEPMADTSIGITRYKPITLPCPPNFNAIRSLRGRVSTDVIPGIEPGSLFFQGASWKTPDIEARVTLFYRETPFNPPGLVDSKGQPPYLEASFAALFG